MHTQTEVNSALGFSRLTIVLSSVCLIVMSSMARADDLRAFDIEEAILGEVRRQISSFSEDSQ